MAGTTAVAGTGTAGNAVIGTGVNAMARIALGAKGIGGAGALPVTERKAVAGTTATSGKTEAGVVAGTAARIKGRTTAGAVARIVAEVVAATEMGVDLAKP